MERNDIPKKEPQSSFRGLYRNVKISVSTLDKVIVGGIAILVVLGLIAAMLAAGYIRGAMIRAKRARRRKSRRRSR